MPRAPDPPTAPAPPAGRLRGGLRRHGIAVRPAEIRGVLGRRGPRFRDGNAVRVFDSGRAALRAMLEAVGRAQRFVHLETYILRDDVVGRRFLAALAERASAGVPVRLLYDAVGSFQLPAASFADLEAAGAEVICFNPLRRLLPRWLPRRRDHRKILVVDGVVAFSGGVNIGEEYDSSPVADESGPGWRDTHLRLEGPVVRDLGAVFLESWFRAGGPDLPWFEILDIESAPAGAVRCGVLPDGPVYRRRAMRDLLVSMLDDARESALLTSPYFAPGSTVLEAMERAVQRGVRVELMLAGRTDHPILRRAAHSVAQRLLGRGVELYEYEAGVFHAKSAVFDGRLAVVGSSNLDRQSLRHSYEVNVVLADPGVAGEVARLFQRDVAGSRRWTLEALARRGAGEKLLDRLSAALVRLVL